MLTGANSFIIHCVSKNKTIFFTVKLVRRFSKNIHCQISNDFMFTYHNDFPPRSKCATTLACNAWKFTVLPISIASCTRDPELLGRIVCTAYVNAAYCYRPSSVVCLSVGRSVTLVSPSKTAKATQTPFGLWTRVRAQGSTSSNVFFRYEYDWTSVWLFAHLARHDRLTAQIWILMTTKRDVKENE